MTYAELDVASDKLAATLATLGDVSGSRIGIYRAKTIDTIVAIYGIIKARCTYVPLDVNAGLERTWTLIGHSELQIIFTEPRLAERLKPMVDNGSIKVLFGSNVPSSIYSFQQYGPIARKRLPLHEHASAYVLYTSGTTGQPKGVEHDHSSALTFATWAAEHFRISCHDRLSCHAPLHFDLTTFDLFSALVSGACTVLIPEEIVLFPDPLCRYVEDRCISIWYSVPSALVQMVHRGALSSERWTSLREIIFAGEVFPPAALRRLSTLLPRAKLTNFFGPTETNVCTYHSVTPEDLVSDAFCPIGIPCPYASIMIVDPNDVPVPTGETGELLISGGSLMRGYLSRPDLDDRAFVFRDGTRYYRTGDQVSAETDRPMIFHGRRDRQVKVRGYRVELDEVENALLRCDGVVAAAAWLHGEPKSIHAAVAGRGLKDERVLIPEIARHLSRYAVPDRIHILSDLPLTSNGKIDRSALIQAAQK